MWYQEVKGGVLGLKFDQWGNKDGFAVARVFGFMPVQDDLNAHKLVVRRLVCDFSQRQPATNEGGESDGECTSLKVVNFPDLCESLEVGTADLGGCMDAVWMREEGWWLLIGLSSEGKWSFGSSPTSRKYGAKILLWNHEKYVLHDLGLYL